MAYTKKDAPVGVSGGPAINFGSQTQDSNRISIQGIENGFITNDGTATPVVSPVAVSAGINTVLTVPKSAVSVTIIPSAALNVSELAAFTQYATIPANTAVTIDVARQKFVYLQGAASASFYFSLID